MGVGRLVQEGLLQQGLGGQGVGKHGEGEGSPIRGTSVNERMEQANGFTGAELLAGAELT